MNDDTWQIDPNELVPGAEISREECERLLGCSYAEERRYGLELLKLAAYVDKAIKRSGRLLTITTRDGGIQVLTHAQASRYNAERFDAAQRLMRRCFRRLSAVDTGSLTESELRNYDRARNSQSRTLAAMRAVNMFDDVVLKATVSKQPPMRPEVKRPG